MRHARSATRTERTGRSCLPRKPLGIIAGLAHGLRAALVGSMGVIGDLFIEIGAGKVVYRQGDAAAELFILESGQIELAAQGRNPMALGPGDFFGIDFLAAGKRREATATVKENARLLRLTQTALTEAIGENPEIAIGLIRRLLERQQVGEVSIAPPAPAPAVVAARAPGASVAPVAPARSFALRLGAGGQLLSLDSARSDFLVGRPDPASGIVPEVDLGPYDANRSLSRRHARILCRDGVYCVREDNATTNGTYVNGERIATGVETPLKPGDKIRFGTIEAELVSI
jgi:hypothetical protein